MQPKGKELHRGKLIKICGNYSEGGPNINSH